MMTNYQTTTLTVLIILFLSTFAPVGSAHAAQPTSPCSDNTITRLCSEISAHYESFGANAVGEYALNQLYPDHAKSRLPYFAYLLMLAALIIALLWDDKKEWNERDADTLSNQTK